MSIWEDILEKEEEVERPCQRQKCAWLLKWHLICRLSIPGGSVVAGDTSSIPGSGRSPRGGNGNPFSYSCLESPMN